MGNSLRALAAQHKALTNAKPAGPPKPEHDLAGSRVVAFVESKTMAGKFNQADAKQLVGLVKTWAKAAGDAGMADLFRLNGHSLSAGPSDGDRCTGALIIGVLNRDSIKQLSDNLAIFIKTPEQVHGLLLGLGTALRAMRRSETLVEIVAPQAIEVQPLKGTESELPLDNGWHFRPGKFWFKRREYRLTGIPLRIVKLMVESQRTIFEEKDFYDAWKDGLTPDRSTVKRNLSTARKSLREVATNIGSPLNIQKDPVPSSDGAWEFLLDKK